MILAQIYGRLNEGHKFCQKYSYLQYVKRVLSSGYMVITGWCHEGNMMPGEVIQAEWSMVHFGQQIDSLLLPKYWCTSQFMAKSMAQI